MPASQPAQADKEEAPPGGVANSCLPASLITCLLECTCKPTTTTNNNNDDSKQTSLAAVCLPTTNRPHYHPLPACTAVCLPVLQEYEPDARPFSNVSECECLPLGHSPALRCYNLLFYSMAACQATSQLRCLPSSEEEFPTPTHQPTHPSAPLPAQATDLDSLKDLSGGGWSDIEGFLRFFNLYPKQLTFDNVKAKFKWVQWSGGVV